MSAPITTTHTPPQRWPVTKYTLDSHFTGEFFQVATSFRTPAPDPKFRFVWTLAPGKRGPGLHFHEQETETFEIVSGTLRIWIEGVPKDYAAGDVVSIPPRVRHRFLNPAKEPVVVNVSLDGPLMEDAFAPIAVATFGRKATTADFARLTVLLASEHPPSTPVIKLERFLHVTVLAVLKLLGFKRFEPVLGWDAERG